MQEIFNIDVSKELNTEEEGEHWGSLCTVYYVTL